MDFSDYITIQNTIAVTGAVSGIIGVLFGYRERKLANESKQLDNISKMEKFLDNDITQVHKVNDILKWRLEQQEIEIKRLRNEKTD